MASGSWNDALVAAGGVSFFFSATCLVHLTLGFEFTMTKFIVLYANAWKRLTASRMWLSVSTKWKMN